MARVLWRDAQGVEGALDLGAAELKIGRAMDCAIRTDDAMVSRHHARVYWGGHGFVVEDLGSANGIFYQEQRVQSHLLKHGDAIRCGSLWLRFIDAAAGAAPGPVEPQAQPELHPGAGAIGHHGPTGRQPAEPRPVPTRGDPAMADEEIRRMKRRMEQLQAELRLLRGGKASADKARQMEDLENDLHAAEEERERLLGRIAELEAILARDSGNVKIQRAVELRGKAAEIVASLNDILSTLRIEVMAAEGEFEQYSHNVPRASFELIRQSLREAATNVDAAREMLRQLRDVAN